jgi:hypothetical protein
LVGLRLDHFLTAVAPDAFLKPIKAATGAHCNALLGKLADRLFSFAISREMTR